MRKGFTLVETLVAVSLFTVAAVIASNVLVDVVQLQKKTEIQNGIYEDARILMQQISNEIQKGTVDYEEYFSVKVLQAKKADQFYGLNYGVYASRFYDPGQSLDNQKTINPDDLGVECSVYKPAPNDNDCEIVFTHSNDLNTGQNPFGDQPENADAFCNKGVVNCDATRNVVDQLYLIDSTGTHKTIIAPKLVDGSNMAVGIVKMTGKDYDQNGVVDIFSCDDGYYCSNKGLADLIYYPFFKNLSSGDKQKFLSDNNIQVPQSSDLKVPLSGHINDSQFLAFSPRRSSVKSLKFIIHPFEDPYKAYAEKDMQSQPSVTIVMTLGLSSSAAEQYPDSFEDVTIQATVAAGVIGKIDSYPPADEFLKKNGTSWIKDVLQSAGF